ncbi:MAG: thioredoxin [Firmicutes bacterium HGW-Firmicutes-16]|nr:MAG: thioredoxin [Firmicutes bacterium HGW-Firmicutes-16]
MNKKKLLIRILVAVLIAGSLTVIWIVKTHPTPDSLSKGSPGELVKAENEEDFALETTAIDLDTLKAYDLPIIIDFGSDSCIPCQQMAPVLVTMNAEMQGKAIIKFVDVWKYSDAAKDFPIKVIPTQVLINSDGTPYVPSDTIGIAFTMYSDKDSNEHVFTVHEGPLTEEEMVSILEDMGVSE